MGAALYARSMGRGQPLFVLLHGFGGHHDVWHDIQPALAAGAQVLAYDLPGHGRSLAFEGAGPPPVAAKAIVGDLQQRGIGQVHLVGHSMGGAIATLIAMRNPDLVRSLTLLAPGGLGPEINFALLRRFGAAANADDLRTCLQEMAAPEYKTETKHVAATAAIRALAGQTEKLSEIAALITRDDRQGALPRDVMAGLPMPVTVVWGTADPVLPFHQSQDLPPNMRVEILPGRGHMLIEEARDRVLRIIRRVTRRV